jgi:hypothetical protein
VLLLVLPNNVPQLASNIPPANRTRASQLL